MKKCQTIGFCIVVLMFLAGSMLGCFGVVAVEATDAIGQAEVSLNSAFVAVAEAQDAGADVARLLERLEAAGDFLSEAHLTFRSGDYEAARLLAVECENKVEGVVTEAGQLETAAELAKIENLSLTAFWSGFGLILLVIFGVVGWMILKKRHFEQVLEMKPEAGKAR
jgi:hypothetical protein